MIIFSPVGQEVSAPVGITCQDFRAPQGGGSEELALNPLEGMVARGSMPHRFSHQKRKMKEIFLAYFTIEKIMNCVPSPVCSSSATFATIEIGPNPSNIPVFTVTVSAPWTAWIPIIQVWTFVTSAGKAWSWIPLLLVPIVNTIVGIYLWICITENLGTNKWLGLLMLLPVINLVLLGILAFSKNEQSGYTGVGATTA